MSLAARTIGEVIIMQEEGDKEKKRMGGERGGVCEGGGGGGGRRRRRRRRSGRRRKYFLFIAVSLLTDFSEVQWIHACPVTRGHYRHNVLETNSTLQVAQYSSTCLLGGQREISQRANVQETKH